MKILQLTVLTTVNILVNVFLENLFLMTSPDSSRLRDLEVGPGGRCRGGGAELEAGPRRQLIRDASAGGGAWDAGSLRLGGEVPCRESSESCGDNLGG